MAKCKNDPINGDEAKEEQVDESAKTVEMEVAHEYGKDAKNDEMEAVENIVTKLSKQKQVLKQKQISEDLDVDECANNSIAEQSMEDVPEDASKPETESSEDDDASHFLEDVSEDKSDDKNKKHIDELDPKTDLSRAESEYPDGSETIDENPNRTTDDKNEDADESSNYYEIPNCSLGEASLNFGEAASEERKRLVSQSDSNADIRNL